MTTPVQAAKISGPKLSGNVKGHLYVDVFEADDGTPDRGKKKKVGCQYENGDRIFGRNADQQQHLSITIVASKHDSILWESAHPFRVDFRIEDRKYFDPPPPWKSTRLSSGVHFVESTQADGDAVKREIERCGSANQGVEVKFMVHMLKGNDPDPSVEELDPHVIIEP